MDGIFSVKAEWYPIWEEPVPFAREDSDIEAKMAVFPVEGSKSCVLVIPGGGYYQLSTVNEGTRVAEEYNKAGITAFVLLHRIRPYGGEAIIADGRRAMRLVRQYAERFGYEKDKIAVCGFSAGGHLSMVLCQHGNEDGGDDARPDACILCYPVTNLIDGTFLTMQKIFLGEKLDEAAKYTYTYDISAMPPTFIWYSEHDTGIDFNKNSVPLDNALEKAGITHECHAFSDGGHGIGLGKDFPECSKWHKLSVDFLKKLGF